MAERKGAHGKALLGLEGADELDTGPGIEFGLGKRYVGGLDLRVTAVDGGIGVNRALSTCIDGDDLSRGRSGRH